MLEITAAQIADLISGKIVGDANAAVSFLSKIEEGSPGTVSFLSNPKLKSFLEGCKSSIVIISEELVPDYSPSHQTWIIVPDAFAAFQKLMQLYQSLQTKKKGIEQPSYIHSSAKVGNDVYIGAFTYIDKDCSVGDEVQVYPQCFIGKNVTIGKNSILYAGVKIYPDTVIGENCVIHSGTVIGSDGFGFMPTDNGYEKVPQLGNVVIENDVEIGANCTIDRAAMGSTIIGKGTKLDNLIQIAHNVKIGEHNVFAAQVGIAGSSVVGNWNMIGGQAGIAGHLKVGNFNKIQAQSGVAGDIGDNEELYGAPAIPASIFRRAYVYFKNLPELAKKIHSLQKDSTK